MGLGRCKVDNAGCWQEKRGDITFSACHVCLTDMLLLEFFVFPFLEIERGLFEFFLSELFAIESLFFLTASRKVN